jgi:hypothetical protein
MKDEEKKSSRLIPVPEILYSDLTGKIMYRCVSCDKNIVESGEPYVIEKAFRYYPEYNISNTIFEYIMCLPCAQKMQESMSEESMQKIQQYFNQVNLIERSQNMWDEYGNDFESWISNCIIKDSPRTGMEEYQVCGQCIGDKLVFDMLPYVLSHEASNEISDLLSNKTLDEYNRFVDDNFGLPPEFKKALKDSPVLV